MKRFVLVLLIFLTMLVAPAQADWRWTDPSFKLVKIGVVCDTVQCAKAAYLRARVQRRVKITKYHARKKAEWRHWTRLYIPNCTWYGESGVGPKYARYRYTMPNSQGSGAHGKFQFKPPTYHDNAKYHDWSPLDQEIAARREYWKHGTSPWTNC